MGTLCTYTYIHMHDDDKDEWMEKRGTIILVFKPDKRHFLSLKKSRHVKFLWWIRGENPLASSIRLGKQKLTNGSDSSWVNKGGLIRVLLSGGLIGMQLEEMKAGKKLLFREREQKNML